ncbi:tetratricopeptide (TPR) repeat protein [Natronospira proteinivora]|uniref:Tetratricopeptide (TPR) repeat protein n=1 Tax=Natronospira proteinivora TaxID=1807133 RepID=A0ABT1G7X0_9GAMM|nr:LysM peptidoglycan-binding domain-containing protein [Natronospira proteinivora]MCP1727045.1 tetratricopeptide (TPR) repeat protein [Natronospira proteinivora]
MSRPSSQSSPSSLLGLAVILLSLTLVGGCAQVREWTQWEDDEADTTAEAPDSERSPYRYQQVVQWLQAGEVDVAEGALARRLDNAPDDARAQLLMEQIQADPGTYLGRENIHYEVQPGDTLSVIAQHFLDDNRLFFILARYNDIEVPAHLEAGETLRIPSDFRDIDAQARLAKRHSDTRDTTGDVWGHLERGEPDEALALFEDQTPDSLNSDEQRALAEAHEAWVERALSQGELTLAANRLERAREDEPDTADWSDWIGQAENRMESETLYRDGRVRMSESPTMAARHFARVLEINPEHTGAQAGLDELRDTVVPQLHREAILLYRNHELDGAIETWEALLRVDPDFEPAQVYKARATELKARLEELDE